MNKKNVVNQSKENNSNNKLSQNKNQIQPINTNSSNNKNKQVKQSNNQKVDEQKSTNNNAINQNFVQSQKDTKGSNNQKINLQDLNLDSPDLKIDEKKFSIPAFGSAFINAFPKPIINNNSVKNNSQQQENNVKDYKLNFTSITVNPIENFYSHIAKSLDEVLEDFFHQKFLSNKTHIDEIQVLTKKINEDKQAIIDKKKELKYNSRLWANGFIIFSFCLIIGIVFIKIFKDNLAAIKEFKKFRDEKNQIIYETTNKRFALIFYAVSTIILKDIYKYVFGRYGIKISEKIPAGRLIKFLNNKNVIDVHSGISGKFKNTPFFDVIFRSLVWENVVTSRSQSYPYTVMVTRYDSNNRPYTAYETRYETLTAYHNEMSPFIYRTNSLVLLTNFEKDFCFFLSPGSEKKPFLENKNFTDRYVVQTPSNNQDYIEKQNISQFFTIKAQEDYVNWFNLNNGQIFCLEKNYNAFIVNNGNYRIDSLHKMNYTIDDVGFLENSVNVDLEETKRRLKWFVSGYFEKFTKMIQMPLLSPTINREWYTKDNQYHIADEMDNFDNKDDQDEFDDLYIVYRFLEKNFYWFNNQKRPDKPIWFNFINKSKSKNITYYEYMMNSFWSEILVDFVSVCGVHVGVKIIPVPYRRFYALKESKFLAHMNFKGVEGKEIMTCPTFKSLLSESQYSNADFANTIQQNFIWTSDPTWLENLKNVNQLISILGNFNSINKQGQMSLIIDEYGAYVLSNVKELSLNKDVEKILDNISNFFKSIS